MASHLASLWNRGLRQLESGQILRIGSHLASLIPNQIFPVEPLIQKWELSQQRIPPVILLFLLLFFCNSVFAGFVFCKIKTNFAWFFSLGRWLCNNRGRCYITAIPRCHLSSSLSPRQSDSKETSSKQNGITEKLKTYLNYHFY